MRRLGPWEDGETCGGAVPPSPELPQDMEKEQENLQAWKERVGQELDRVVAFWMEHSHDQEHGYPTLSAGFLPLLTPRLTLRQL